MDEDFRTFRKFAIGLTVTLLAVIESDVAQKALDASKKVLAK